MKKLIEEGFGKVIDDIYPDNDNIRRFLKEHERRYLFIENLEREIKKSGCLLDVMTGDHEKKMQTIKRLIKDLTITFCKLALETKLKELKTLGVLS